jgi:hypothetical protein
MDSGIPDEGVAGDLAVVIWLLAAPCKVQGATSHVVLRRSAIP